MASFAQCSCGQAWRCVIARTDLGISEWERGGLRRANGKAPSNSDTTTHYDVDERTVLHVALSYTGQGTLRRDRRVLLETPIGLGSARSTSSSPWRSTSPVISTALPRGRGHADSPAGHLARRAGGSAPSRPSVAPSSTGGTPPLMQRTAQARCGLSWPGFITPRKHLLSTISPTKVCRPRLTARGCGKRG
jgi:hypothetical protein